jgi:methylenetetrahydrofolate dehydrogenase (NADP+)/methenyltetrahydrofolate cyclohydrolase
MSAHILDGVKTANTILDALTPHVRELNPHLVIIQVGSDPASTSYIRKKLDSAARISMRATHLHLPATTTSDVLLRRIAELNADDDVTGMILQLPLPSPLSTHQNEALNAIDTRKDVDGLTDGNLGAVLRGTEASRLVPATAAGVIALLDAYDIPIAGKHAVVVGRSTLVGKPLALMLLQRSATVTVAHRQTSDVAAMIRQGEIVCAAAGSAKFITKEMIRPGAVVIDIGVSRVGKKLSGDVDFENVKDIASVITPVPGGVGPMTVAMLLKNCITAARHLRSVH